jgi:cyclopropane-fatty-acyl-phospholipid synthase
MKTIIYKTALQNLLALAGIEIDGEREYDIQVHDERFYKRVMTEAELGLGESFMDGWWDVARLDEMICRVLRAGLRDQVRRNFRIILQLAGFRLINMQAKRRAFIIGERHYDLGNDLFQGMLDRRMNYSCAYWKNAQDLDQAQEDKLELICRKLALAPGMKVLDIGCGWGSFGRYAAEKYGVRVTGITVSKEQVALGRTICAGWPVEFRLCDYRDLTEKFDRIVSIGMFEHVGVKNYRAFFKLAAQNLTAGGLVLLHTIGDLQSGKSCNPWIHKYIFPNGMLPSVSQIGRAIEALFIMEDWHNLGADYDKTLMAWYRNFSASWPRLKEHYSERFRRMWIYFLLSCAGSFRARHNQVWQIILSPAGVPGGYCAVR